MTRNIKWLEQVVNVCVRERSLQPCRPILHLFHSAAVAYQNLINFYWHTLKITSFFRWNIMKWYSFNL